MASRHVVSSLQLDAGINNQQQLQPPADAQADALAQLQSLAMTDRALLLFDRSMAGVAQPVPHAGASGKALSPDEVARLLEGLSTKLGALSPQLLALSSELTTAGWQANRAGAIGDALGQLGAAMQHIAPLLSPLQ